MYSESTFFGGFIIFTTFSVIFSNFDMLLEGFGFWKIEELSVLLVLFCGEVELLVKLEEFEELFINNEEKFKDFVKFELLFVKLVIFV